VSSGFSIFRNVYLAGLARNLLLGLVELGRIVEYVYSIKIGV
jgi:hypothetical protein